MCSHGFSLRHMQFLCRWWFWLRHAQASSWLNLACPAFTHQNAQEGLGHDSWASTMTSISWIEIRKFKNELFAMNSP